VERSSSRREERGLPVSDDPVDRAKRMASKEAAGMVRSGQIVGLGTGSTAAMAIQELGRRVREEGLVFTGVATSYQAAGLARALGIPVRTLDEVSGIDLAIDGADEVDPGKNLIKGGGGAHLREKVIAAESDPSRFSRWRWHRWRDGSERSVESLSSGWGSARTVPSSRTTAT
jgi:hypothetical protein